MTKMLASVTGPDEAEVAVAGGADIIDLKDARAGALGAVPTEILRRAVSSIAGRRPVSAVCGDLPMEPETIRAKAEEIAAAGADYVKIGFFPSPAGAKCAEAMAALARPDQTDCRAFRRSVTGLRTCCRCFRSMAFTASWSIPPIRRKGGCSTTCLPNVFQISLAARRRFDS